MKVKKYLAVISLLVTISLQAQQAQNIHGFVFDATSKEILIGALVFDSVTGKGTVSNEFGYYNLMLFSNEPIYIQVSYIGYKKQSFKTRHADSSRYDIYMYPGIELGEVKVTADRMPDITRTTETSTIRLPMREVKMLPNLFGEVDIVKAYQLTPGVQSGGEGKSDLYVRGGSPDQNLIILDDVPLYYVSHFGGFFSVFNVDAINDVKLIKGGFPARYGGRLSSVMDIRMKDGNMNKTTGAGSIGLLSTKLMVEGPILKDKSSFMVSARRNLLSPFNLARANMKYNFYDLNAKLNYRLTKKDRLFFSFYAGNDIVQVANDSPQNYAATKVKWGNLALAVRYNRVFSDKIFGNLILASTQYRYINSFENKIVSDTVTQLLNSELHTGINDLMVKGDFSWQVSSSYLLRFGCTGIHHSITPNDEVFDKSIGDRPVFRAYNFTSIAYENSIYAENEISIPFGGLNIGFRYVHFLIDQQTYHFVEPRLNLNIPLQADLSVKVSYAISNQFLHLLSYSGAGMPADYWMPSTANLKPSQAKQLTAGVAKTFNDGLFQLSIEAYHKSLYGLIAFKPGSSLMGNLSSWENVVVSGGKGLNYGVEFFLQKVQGRSTGWAGITMARAERQFAVLNKGKSFPFKYDRLLDISLVWNFKVNPKVNISATWTYGSGYPVTLATERYDTEDGEVFVYDDINSFRMRDYHRLDFAVNFPKKTKWGERAWSLSVFNLYNRKNPFYYYYQREMVDNSPVSGSASKEGALKLYQRTLFGIFPSISYNFKF